MTQVPLKRRSVLIVDDSAFMRKLIAEMVGADPQFTVSGFARNGVDALEQSERLDPDVIILDLEMPELDGLQVLEQIMLHSPKPVVVLSAGGPQFGDAAIRALELGAIDFVKKPSGSISLDLQTIGGQLLEALRSAVTVDMTKVRQIDQAPRHGHVDVSLSATDTRRQARPHQAVGPAKRVVVMASSTGGPRALAQIIPALPQDLQAAVLIAQHMPKDFTHSMAERLDRMSALRVTEAIDGELIMEGHVYVAPGRTHMRVTGTPGAATLAIEPDPARGTVCPSADELFTSAVQRFDASVVGVILTGMGRDGTKGALAVRGAGGCVLVQDRETSVIYGMPNAALTGAGADHIVALGDMAVTIVRAVAHTQDAKAAVGTIRV